jgi:YHS domain-containing protein
MTKLLTSLTLLIVSSIWITASAATFNVKLRDSNGGQSLNYSEASLTFEDGGTITASHDGAGNFVVNTSGNSVKVSINYLGATKSATINADYTFNTVRVTADLQESDGDSITSNASWQYRFGWGSHIAFDPVVGVELLPVNTKVKVTYLGASVEKQQNTNTNAHLDFNTVKLTASLEESDNDDITSAASWEYRFGWGAHIAFDPVVGVELLPVNTKVKVTYLGASVEKQQNTKTNAHLDFNTVKLTASLEESDNDDITSAASWEYRFGWGTHIAFDPE